MWESFGQKLATTSLDKLIDPRLEAAILSAIDNRSQQISLIYSYYISQLLSMKGFDKQSNVC